ncbi:glucosamine-6-phosphate deaminase [Pseudoroseicyclus tamaricis]|uniref:Glucosamine-6-phosphate deaminase n=1 Tax=Pseudoroseicyclus tamaricis TaxID=2705421 RepID=A0A6B2JWQ6_9RHOB|nr:glucosamine-6-phosphate deaminase [Pseudoroseicyclus tamaricis]NDV01099.1 glucosamine-6-phosphate deaminase [Pseudoroseicyclus tamaricis]
MKILIHQTKALATDCAASLIAARLNRQPDTVLGLATGGTMEMVYANLIARHRAGEVSFAQATSFNLDEYVGLPETHPCSYWHYMREKLFDHVDIDPGRAFLPHGDAPDAEAEAERYEAAIARAGDIGLQLLGLGLNGHIGFNEPTSSLSSLTRIKTLTRSTREANARYFDDPQDVPRLAITMGIGTILRAQEVVLLAYGAEKADVVARMIEGPVAAACPASALQMHRKVTVVLDEAAAGALELRDYYEQVHPRVGETSS